MDLIDWAFILFVSAMAIFAVWGVTIIASLTKCYC